MMMQGTIVGITKGDARSLHYGSFGETRGSYLDPSVIN